MPEPVVTFALATTTVDAVQRALYRMSDRLSCDLGVEVDTIRCTLFLTDDAGGDPDSVIAELRNEVLDETLRARVREETREVRNLILALAFSDTGLVDPDDA